MPKRFDGMSLGFVILLRPGARESLLSHEMTHCKQFWRTFGLHGLLYLLSRKYRYRAEIEAYRAEIKEGFSVERAALYITTLYRLEVARTQALADLLK